MMYVSNHRADEPSAYPLHVIYFEPGLVPLTAFPFTGHTSPFRGWSISAYGRGRGHNPGLDGLL